jgi:hypothetical protein
LAARLACIALVSSLCACAAVVDEPGAIAGAAPVPATDPALLAPALLAQLADIEAACIAAREEARARGRDLEDGLAAQSVSLKAHEGMLHAISTQLAAGGVQVVDAPMPACAPTPSATEPKLVVGRREQVWVDELQLALPARIDTGAETASLDARAIQPFERDGRDWVRFEMEHPDTGELIVLEHEVRRVVRILQSTSDEGERRPVIELGIVIGDVRQRAEFTLSDRSHLDHQMLVGRNVLLDLMVVDVSKVNAAPYRLPAQAGTAANASAAR